MTDHERGAYAPQNDAPLAFDPRRAGGRRGPAPITLAISAFVMVAVFIGIVLLYGHGARQPGAAPQVVGQPVGDFKSVPTSSSDAASDSSAGLQIYKTESAPPSEAVPPPTFAPGPEAPQARPVTHAPPPPAPVTSVPLRAAEPAPTAPPALAKAVPPKAPPKTPPAAAGRRRQRAAAEGRSQDAAAAQDAAGRRRLVRPGQRKRGGADRRPADPGPADQALSDVAKKCADRQPHAPVWSRCRRTARRSTARCSAALLPMRPRPASAPR